MTPNVGTSIYKPVPLSEGAGGGRIRGGRSGSDPGITLSGTKAWMSGEV